MRKAVYAGSFDPITFGHLDIIERTSKMYDHVYVCIGNNINKDYLFSVEERVQVTKELTKHLDNVSVEPSDRLIVDFVREKNAHVIVRGLRAVSDFEYEMTFATTNQMLAHDIETVFLMSRPTHSFVSSSLVKEIWRFGGDLEEFIAEPVISLLKSKDTKEK